MSVTEGHRLALHEAASQHWGRDVAVTLMEMLPPSGWGDVATRQQLDALESRIDVKLESLEMRMDARFTAMDSKFTAIDSKFESRFEAIDRRFEAIDTRFEAIDLRFDAIDARFDAADERTDLKLATLESRIGTQLAIGHRQLMQWTVGTMIAMTGVFAALVSIIK